MWKPNKNQITIAGSAAGGLILGAAGMYFGMSKKLEAKYAAIANEEIRTAQKSYVLMQPKPEPEELAAKYEVKPDPEMEEALEALKSYTGEAIVRDEDPEEPSDVSIFDRQDDNFDYEVEVSKRNTVDPFIITAEEFYQNEPDHVQVNMTYYEGDDILSDGKDQPVEEIEHTVGFECLERFGAGSGDPNLVFVRNGRLQMDFEIIHSGGSYAEEVHGIIQHSDERRVRKFRTYDD